MGAALVMRVTAEHVGQRVSLRRVVAGSPRRPVYADVVGELISFADGVLRVRRRSGEVVDVPQATVVAGKVVPARPR